MTVRLRQWNLEYDLDHYTDRMMGGRSESKSSVNLFHFLPKIRNSSIFDDAWHHDHERRLLDVKIRANLDGETMSSFTGRVDPFQVPARAPSVSSFPRWIHGVLMILCAVLHKCEQNRIKSTARNKIAFSVIESVFTIAVIIIVHIITNEHMKAGKMSREKQMFMYWETSCNSRYVRM